MLRFESLELEVFKQNVLTLVRIHQGPKEYNFLFNEIHYVHAWQNRFAERFKLPTVVDQHAALDYSSNEQLAALIQAELVQSLAPHAILFQIAEDILQELKSGLSNSPDHMLYQQLSGSLEKLKFRVGELPMRAIATDDELMRIDGKLTVDPSLIFRHLLGRSLNEVQGSMSACMGEATADLKSTLLEDGPVRTYWISQGAANWVETFGQRGLIESGFITLSDLSARWLQNRNEVRRSVDSISQYRDLFALALLNTPAESRENILSELSLPVRIPSIPCPFHIFQVFQRPGSLCWRN